MILKSQLARHALDIVISGMVLLIDAREKESCIKLLVIHPEPGESPMKHTFTPAILLALILIVPCFPCPAESAQPVRHLQTTDLRSKAVAVEDLKAEYYTETKLITVRAKITNMSQHVIKGHVTVYLLDESGGQLYAYEEPVNRGRPFGLGQSVTFEISTKVRELEKVASLSVDFTED